MSYLPNPGAWVKGPAPHPADDNNVAASLRATLSLVEDMPARPRLRTARNFADACGHLADAETASRTDGRRARA